MISIHRSSSNDSHHSQKWSSTPLYLRFSILSSSTSFKTSILWFIITRMTSEAQTSAPPSGLLSNIHAGDTTLPLSKTQSITKSSWSLSELHRPIKLRVFLNSLKKSVYSSSPPKRCEWFYPWVFMEDAGWFKKGSQFFHKKPQNSMKNPFKFKLKGPVLPRNPSKLIQWFKLKFFII